MRVSEHNKELYEDLFSKGYHKSHELKVIKMTSLIKGQPKRILDIGCGDGWFGAKLKKVFGAEVTGVDILDKALITAKKKGLLTKKFDLSKNNWPLKSNYFDLIIAGDIIEHVYDTENFIKECKRLLKKGGQLIISTPNINSYANRFLLLFGKMPLYIDFAPNLTSYDFVEPSGHVRVFNNDSLKRLVTHYGLRVDRVIGAGFQSNNELAPGKFKLLGKLFNGVERFFSHFKRHASIIVMSVIK
ncbi:MAG: class I SAM-dependent methyltransferase [Candidatus Nanoarchaeia archaeon]|jgi:2-polyprenyl-3-methyl-5-hydroxy-6-metoxy-1,4-benzoquinol methylase